MSKIDDFEKTYTLLNNYNGSNNQILYLKYKIKNGDYALSDFDVTYVLNNYNYQPYELNKTVKISSDYGENLKKKYELDFLPVKIKITKVIGEMGESIHCYVQYRKSVMRKAILYAVFREQPSGARLYGKDVEAHHL